VLLLFSILAAGEI
jgi:hypothetical protein